MLSINQLLILVFICLAPFAATSKVAERYAVSNISDSLRDNASAVIRYDSTEIKVDNLNMVKLKRKYAITILKEEASVLGNINEWYDNQSKINDITGSFYDAEGTLIKTLKKRDIIDRSSYGLTFEFNSDNRLKIYSFSHNNYPYTVVYEIEKTIKTTFFIPSWDPQINHYCALETANLQISFPENINIRVNELLFPATTVRSSNTDKGIITKSWKIENLSAFDIQPLSTEENYIKPTLIFASNQFDLMGHKGSMETWKKFGQFYYELNDGRDQLPDATKIKVKELIKNDTSIIQKVQTLYEYMQQNTRYVADEFGLAGWQTIDANYVCTKGYGDCKGLTNYLRALLKEAGIPSYITLINAGKNYYKVNPQFPNSNFNHVILCVPNNKDTIWVESTSAYNRAGYLGSFTENRSALLCTENGGYLITTPEYGKGKTFLYRTAKMNYNNSKKEQTVVLENTYSGLFQDDLLALLKTQNKEEIHKINNSKFPFPSYSLSQYDAQIKGSQRLPQIQENATLAVMGIVNKTDKRTFINLGWLSNPMKSIFQLEERTAPIVLLHSFIVRDSIYLYFTDDLKLEAAPTNVNMNFPFANLNCSFHQEKDHLLLVREYEQKAGTYKASFYTDYQKMYTLLNAQQEQLQFVFEKKEE